jgi:hypothetical protein
MGSKMPPSQGVIHKPPMLDVIQEMCITMVGMFHMKLLPQGTRRDNTKSKEHSYWTKPLEMLIE